MKYYYLKNRNALVCFFTSNILAAVSSVFLSFLLGIFADAAMEGSFSRVWKLALGTLAYICFETYFNYLLQFTRDAAIHKIGRDMRADVVRKIEKLPYEEKEKKDDGYYISMVNNDIAVVEQEYLDSLGAIFFQMCCFVIAIAASLIIQPWMTAIMLAVSVLPVVFPKLTEKKLQESKEAEQQAKAFYLAAIAQILSGFFLLKVFNSFAGINREHDKENDKLRDAKIKFSRLSSVLYAGAYGCGNLVYLGTWVVGLFFVAKDLITLPGLITFSQLMTFVAGPIQIISERFSMTIAASAVCKRIIKFLDATTDEELHWGNVALDGIDAVELKALSYAVGDKKLLQDIDLCLHKGDRVALLGESGSGKTTLMKILAAICDGQGEFIINSQPHHSYSYSDFRNKVALLEQKSFVFDATIQDNLTMFSERGPSSGGELLQILERVGLAKWYEDRGASPRAEIGSGRQGLSGGEERRLDLGRILYRRAGLVMLDEPTTGLDKESRLLAEKTIKHLNCDILIVAMHEYSSDFLSSFNRVLTIKDGKIQEKSI